MRKNSTEARADIESRRLGLCPQRGSVGGSILFTSGDEESTSGPFIIWRNNFKNALAFLFIQLYQVINRTGVAPV